MSIDFVVDMTSSLALETSTALAICEVLDTPRSLTVALLIKHCEWQQLIDLEVNPLDYQDHSNFADDYLATSLLSKSPNLPLGIDRKQVALDSFMESERRCRATNDRILAAKGSHPKGVADAIRLVRKLLGPLKRKDLEKIESNFRFGPGATTGVRGSGSVLSDKYDEEIHLTHGLVPFYRAMLGETWWSERRSPEIVKGNKFTTVPKSAKTDRGICIEPTLNIYGQLGIGAVLRQRLLRLGVDLSNQARNQELASIAYSDRLATIDLSAASDSLSWSVVMEFLPYEWFELLELFRSPFTLVGDCFLENEKFSSMGNGYTFELESLIFAAVALSIVPLCEHHHVSVYGDDIIVPQAYANDVVDALNYLGFKVNGKKSFLAGSFFESCGTDWFNGQNVRPFYLRKELDSKFPYSMQIANALRIYASRRLNGLGCDARFRSIWVALYKATPKTWRRCKVPLQLGDTGFIVSFDEAKPRKAKYGWQGWTVRAMRVSPKRFRKETIGRLLAALACPAIDRATYGYEPRRGFLGRPVPKWVTVDKWPEGFDWV